MNISLENFDSTQYQQLINWIGNEESLMQFAGPAFSFPLTISQLEKSLSDEKRFAFSVFDRDTRESIGHAEIYLAETSAWLGRIIVADENLRGKGIGKEIVALLLKKRLANSINRRSN